MLDQLAYLTGDLPGTGGAIKERPEDFLVDEQPLYQPSGQGEHLYVFVEKRELTTSDVVRRLAKAFRVGKRDIGYAGLKDKHAVTRQHFSVYLPDASRDREGLAQLEMPTLKMLWSERHANKLRRGHLAGNRFVIRIRNVDPTAVVPAKRVLDRLAQTGTPNYVGDQRFGYRGDNHVLGRLLLQRRWQELLDAMLGAPRDSDYAATRAGREAYERGDYAAALEHWPRHLRTDRRALDALRCGRPAEKVVAEMDEIQRDFLVSALQSAVFNRVLHRRITDNLFDRLMEGDLAWKHDSRAVFAVDAATAAAENAPGGRVQRLEVSPSGPMWGSQMTRAAGQVDQREREALQEMGVSEEDFKDLRHASGAGTRRSVRQVLRDPDVSAGVDEHGPYIRLAFELGRGGFATVVLREIMKSAATMADETLNGED